MLYGGRVTIGLALVATLLGCGMGVLVGFGASLSGRTVDSAVAAAIDFLLSLPPILFALVIIAGLGPSVPVLVLVVSIIHMSRVAALPGLWPSILRRRTLSKSPGLGVIANWS